MPIKHIIIFNVFKFTELRKGIKILINQNCFGLSAIQPGLEKKIKNFNPISNSDVSNYSDFD